MKNINIENTFLDITNPLTVGNGDLAVTVDCLGTQTLYDSYTKIPLLSMSNTCWVTDKHPPTLKLKSYCAHHHKVSYMTDAQGQEENYQKLRQYPYKFNFFIYKLYYKDNLVSMRDITDINQELNLYHGIIKTKFKYLNKEITTKAMVDLNKEVFRFEFDSLLEDLSIKICFPRANWNFYGSLYPKLDNFTLKENHIIRRTEHEVFDAYLHTNMDLSSTDSEIILSKKTSHGYFEFSIHKDYKYDADMSSFFDSLTFPKLDILGCNEEDLLELKRRMYLSIYLLKVNSLGKYPAQETGLTLNSWNSKFHLEMHPWQSLWAVEYGCLKELEKQLDYYLTIQESARQRAKIQGYQGIRFPKMTSPFGEDSPSNIGCLLLWQEPHIFLMIDCIYRKNKDINLIKKYYPILSEIILFLQSFLYKDFSGKYHLDFPLIPVQECFDSIKTRDPIFEVEYVRYAFKKMILFTKLIGNPSSKEWIDIEANLILPKIEKGAYLACWDEQGEETYTKFNYDHPSVVMPYSLFKDDYIDEKIMNQTLDYVLSSYNMEELWGWDFPMMAMVAARLGRKEDAIRLLLLKTHKNLYLKNGHNPQGNRKDLPIYLPGNGAYLLALALLCEE